MGICGGKGLFGPDAVPRDEQSTACGTKAGPYEVSAGSFHGLSVIMGCVVTKGSIISFTC